MPRIDLGGFGRSVPETTQARDVPMVDIGASVQRLGQGIHRFGQQLEARREERKREEEAAERTRAMLASKEAGLEMDRAVESIMDERSTGVLADNDAADEAFQMRIQGIKEGFLDQFPEARRERYRNLIEAESLGRIDKYENALRGFTQQSERADIQQLEETAANRIVKSPNVVGSEISALAAVYDARGAATGMNPQQIDQRKARQFDRMMALSVRRKIEEAPSFQSLRDMIPAIRDEKKTPHLQAETREKLVDMVGQELRSRQAELDSRARQNEMRIQTVLSGYKDMLDSGQRLEPETKMQMAEDVANAPPSAARDAVRMRLEMSDVIRSFYQMREPNRVRFLAEVSKELDAETDARRKAELYMKRDILESVSKRATESFDKQPWKTWEKVTGTPSPPLDPENLFGSLRERMPVWSDMVGATGQNPGLFDSDDAVVVSKVLQTMEVESPHLMGEFFDQLLTLNRDAVQRSAQVMAQREPVAAASLSLALAGEPETASNLLRGARNLREKLVKEPSKVGGQSFDEWFDRRAGGAFDGQEQARDIARKSVMSYWAWMKGAGESQQPDDKSMQVAFERVMGRKERMNLNGTEFFPPMGMDDMQFMEQRRRAIRERFANEPLMLRDYEERSGLMPSADPNVFFVVMAGEVKADFPIVFDRHGANVDDFQRKLVKFRFPEN
jgi:hypothetical protein